MKPIAFLFAALVCLGLPASAQNIDCRLTANSPTAGMPPQILIRYTPPTAQAVVSHGWIEGPVTHNVSVNRSGDQMSFSVSNPARVSGRTAIIHLSMFYRFASRSMTVSSAPGAGFVGRARGTYACTGG